MIPKHTQVTQSYTINEKKLKELLAIPMEESITTIIIKDKVYDMYGKMLYGTAVITTEKVIRPPMEL